MQSLLIGNILCSSHLHAVQEELADATVLIVCLTHATKSGNAARLTSIEELPARCTVGQLPAVLGIPEPAQILVSHLQADLELH